MNQEEVLKLIIQQLTESVKDSRVEFNSLFNLLIDKNIITKDEYQQYYDRENELMNEMIKEAEKEVKEVMQQIKKDSMDSIPFFGPTGEA